MGTPGDPGAGASLPLLGSGLGWFNQRIEGPIYMSSDSIGRSMWTERAVTRADVNAFDLGLLAFGKVGFLII